MSEPQESLSQASAIEACWPAWLAQGYGDYARAYQQCFEGAFTIAQGRALLKQQQDWARDWLQYLLLLQASGLWLARHPLADWNVFPACCQPDCSLYLLWQGLEQVCRLEQKGPLPFRQMHQWLGAQQTGWGLLLNLLLQLERESDVDALVQGLRYAEERLNELLRNAQFMERHEIYAVIGPVLTSSKAKAAQVLGVRYRRRAAKGLLSGQLPVGEGGLYLEEPRLSTRFQLPFLRLCPDCLDAEVYTPLVWQRRSLDQGLGFGGCPHAPVWFAEQDLQEMPSAAAYARGFGRNWKTMAPDAAPEQTACVVLSELQLDPLLTLRDPQHLLQTFEELVTRLLSWLRPEGEAGPDGGLQIVFDAQSVVLACWQQPTEGLDFALALHSLLASYNRRQSLAADQLQVRSGIDFGAIVSSQDGISGPAWSGARRLAALARPGQLLASAPAQAQLARGARSGLFQPVGQLPDGPQVYTLYARSLGVRELPAGLLGSPEQPLPPSRLETAHLLGRGLPVLDLPSAALPTALSEQPRQLQNHLGMLFRLLYPGRFMMGSAEQEPGRLGDETRHLVVLERPFYLMTTPVTQRQWEQLMGSNPAYFKHPDRPVESVSWDDVQVFIVRLNALGAASYRLPSEAEWEYGCRAGSSGPFCFAAKTRSSGSRQLDDYAWYAANAAQGGDFPRSHPVATRLPNHWGLYDMHGNVWEWVADWYAEHSPSLAHDPSGPAQGLSKVIKGGRWNSQPANCRSASRSSLAPDQHQPGSLGFRLVMEP